MSFFLRAILASETDFEETVVICLQEDTLLELYWMGSVHIQFCRENGFEFACVGRVRHISGEIDDEGTH